MGGTECGKVRCGVRNYYPYPKCGAVKNYFPMPNEIFSLDLSSGEISVYSYLMYCEDRKTFQCHPSYKTIGRAMRMSPNTVRKYVDCLREKRLISTEPTQVVTKNGRKCNGNLRYTIRPIEEAIKHHFEIQLRKAEEEQTRLRRIAALEKYDRKHRKTSG